MKRPFFPCGNISQVSPSQVKQYLINAFSKWGLPKSIRVDNGMPLGDPQRKSLPVLCLWLEAMGIEVIYNRPRRPTDNAKVERMQRTTKDWAEVYSCKDYKQLQKHLDKVGLIQREKFKVSRLKGKTRKECYPKLFTNQRIYKAEHFNPQRAFQRLDKWIFARRTSKIGQFTLYGNVYYLGTKFPKQYVSVKFDSSSSQWKVSDSKGKFIKAFNAINFDQENLWNLTISQRTSKKGQT